MFLDILNFELTSVSFDTFTQLTPVVHPNSCLVTARYFNGGAYICHLNCRYYLGVVIRPHYDNKY